MRGSFSLLGLKLIQGSFAEGALAEVALNDVFFATRIGDIHVDIPSQGPVFVETDVHYDMQLNLAVVRVLNVVAGCQNLGVAEIGRACVFEFTVPNIGNGELGFELVAFRILHRPF